MSNEEFTEISQPENLETLTPRAGGSKKPRQKVRELLRQQYLASNGPVIELKLDADTNNQQETDRNNRKRKKVSTRFDLNKIADQLVLFPNAKPPGQS